MSRARIPYFCLARTTIERPSGVSSASEESCAASASSRSLTPRCGMNAGLTIAERDGPGLVEQQCVDVAGGFDGAAGDGDDVGWIRRSMPAIRWRTAGRRSWSGSGVTSSATSTATVIEPPV